MRLFNSAFFLLVLEAAEFRRVVTRLFDGLYQCGGRGRAAHLRGAFGEIDRGLVHAGHAAQRRLHRRVADGGGGLGMVSHRYATHHLIRARSEATATPANKTLDLMPRNTVDSGQAETLCRTTGKDLIGRVKAKDPKRRKQARRRPPAPPSTNTPGPVKEPSR